MKKLFLGLFRKITTVFARSESESCISVEQLTKHLTRPKPNDNDTLT